MINQQAQYNRILNSFISLKVAQHRAHIDHYCKLITRYKEYFQKRLMLRKETAEGFNIFKTLWINEKENYHSRFLVYLLDPNEGHHQGPLFINAFLEELRKKEFPSVPEPVSESQLHNVHVYPEEVLAEKGRVDISIRLPNTIILIENKVNQDEREAQLRDYRDWLDKQQAETKILVFLTPEERTPISGTADICLSYLDISRLVSIKIGQKASGLAAVLQQYKEICEELARRKND